MTHSMRRRAPQALLILGIVFLILGLRDQAAFIAIGAAFIAIGAASARRERRASGSESEE